MGLKKCRDVILMTLGNISREYDEEIVKCAIEQIKNGTVILDYDLDPKIIKKLRQRQTSEKKMSDKKLLGKLNVDVIFLENFIKKHETKSKKKETKKQSAVVKTGLKSLATEALGYLEKRKYFWDQTEMF